MLLSCRQTLPVQGFDDVYEIVKKVVDDLLGVKVICVTFDGWSDNQVYLYLGLIIAYLTGQWEHRLFTISCKMLKRHTAVDMSKHVREERDSFFDGGTKNIRIFTTHDGQPI